MAKFAENPVYSDRTTTALYWVSQWHNKQIRKQKNTPYLAHLLSVAAIVWENDGTEDEAIAALAHDAVEDAGIPIDDIQALFGKRVADIVAALTEDKTLEKCDRKAAYVRSVDRSDRGVALVSAADKLHNLRSYVQSPELVKSDVIEFYGRLYPVYEAHLEPIVPFQSTTMNHWLPNNPIVAEMRELMLKKLIPFYSVYWVGDEDEGELRLSDSILDSHFKTMRVATSEEIVERSFERQWQEFPYEMRLADGNFLLPGLVVKRAAFLSELGASDDLSLLPRV